MILKLFFSIFGFFLMVIVISHTIVYTNLLSFGYSINEYLSYLISRYECWYFVIGLIIEVIVVFRKGKNNVKCI